MFDNPNKRYMTSNIAEELHPEIVLHLWKLIDNRREIGEELDYLQVFELTVSNKKQVVIHRQEIPSYKKQWIITLKHAEPITRTIWCIDNGDETQIMMQPSDYYSESCLFALHTVDKQ